MLSPRHPVSSIRQPNIRTIRTIRTLCTLCTIRTPSLLALPTRAPFRRQPLVEDFVIPSSHRRRRTLSSLSPSLCVGTTVSTPAAPCTL